MLIFCLRRMAYALCLILGVTAATFFLLHLAPGDPVDVLLGESASPSDRAALTAALGLDRPLAGQYASYLRQVLQLNFGNSLVTQESIGALLAQRLPYTAWLACVTLIFAVLLGVPLGMLCAVRVHSRMDQLLLWFSAVLQTLPSFWLGPILVLIFSIQLGWLPVSGHGSAATLVLPVLTLGLGLAAVQARLTRVLLLEVLHLPHVRAARARGLRTPQVLWRHGLRVAAIPLVTVLALQFGALLSGAVITESLFQLPGLGELTVQSLHRRDYPTVQACVLVIAAVYALVNALADMLAAWLDPRVSL